MKAGAPWSIKGIDPEAREAAKRAAARAGMTLGEWFNHVLTTADPGAAIVQSSGEVAPEPSGAVPAQAVQVDDAALRAEIETLSASVRTLAERLDATEESTATHLEALAARVERAEAAPPPPAGSDEGAMEALRALAEKVDGIDKIRRDATGELQAALRDLAQHTEEVRTSSEQSIGDTRASLDALSQRIERSFEKSNEAVATVGKAIEMMASRLTRLEQRMQDASADLAPETAIPARGAGSGMLAAGGFTGAAALATAATADQAMADTGADLGDGDGEAAGDILREDFSNDAGPTGSDREDWLPESDASATEGTNLTGPEAARWLHTDDAADAPADDSVAAESPAAEAAPGVADWDDDGMETITRTEDSRIADDRDDALAAKASWMHAPEEPATDRTGGDAEAVEPQRAVAEAAMPGTSAVSEDVEEAPFDVDAYLDAHLAQEHGHAGRQQDTGMAASAEAFDAADTAMDAAAEPQSTAFAAPDTAGEPVDTTKTATPDDAERPAQAAYPTSTIDAFLDQFTDEDGIVLDREEEPYAETASPAAEVGTEADDGEMTGSGEERSWAADEMDAGTTAGVSAGPVAAAGVAAAGVADAPEAAAGRRPEDVIAAIRKAARGDSLDEDLDTGTDDERLDTLFGDDDEDGDEFADAGSQAQSAGGGRKLRIGLVAASIVVLLAGGSYLVL
ncbi:MAG: hypothetical protein LPL00_05225 [Alphaproteobacteria bacterium]|nr:hypothetical protein [Alphaproteobacteria bacterium]MDX5368918.1 hypothetical protein [Alphaproteobacteria bacterium]MDX5463642.1 hypothetical protein [Alphaproteobacteria bacterium]